MAKRLRDKSGRVFLHCEQLAARKGFTAFDEEDFETVEATPPKRRKKVTKKTAAKPEKPQAAESESGAEAPAGLEDWD